MGVIMGLARVGIRAALVVVVAAGPARPGTPGDARLPAGIREVRYPYKPIDEICGASTLWRGEAEVGKRYYGGPDSAGRDRLLAEIRTEAGRAEGPSRWWYRSGRLRRLQTYRAGLLDGPAGAWDEGGRTLWRADFVAGTGVLKTFSPVGALEAECPYRVGLKHGNERRWHPNGNLASDAGYKGGRPDGWARTYDEAGRLLSESLAVPGEIGPPPGDPGPDWLAPGPPPPP